MLEARLVFVEGHLGRDLAPLGARGGRLLHVVVELEARHDRACERVVMAEAPAPVENRQPLATTGGEREHVGERDEHVVRAGVAARDLGGLVVDAERIRSLDRGQVVGPFLAVAARDRVDRPALRLTLPALRHVLPFRRRRRRPEGSGAGL